MCECIQYVIIHVLVVLVRMNANHLRRYTLSNKWRHILFNCYSTAMLHLKIVCLGTHTNLHYITVSYQQTIYTVWYKLVKLPFCSLNDIFILFSAVFQHYSSQCYPIQGATRKTMITNSPTVLTRTHIRQNCFLLFTYSFRRKSMHFYAWVWVFSSMMFQCYMKHIICANLTKMRFRSVCPIFIHWLTCAIGIHIS